jgi:hypothetical protein
MVDGPETVASGRPCSPSHAATISFQLENKGPGAVCFTLPARAISTKNKHLLLSCDTNPRIHGGSFGVWGHTSSEALKL